MSREIVWFKATDASHDFNVIMFFCSCKVLYSYPIWNVRLLSSLLLPIKAMRTLFDLRSVPSLTVGSTIIRTVPSKSSTWRSLDFQVLWFFWSSRQRAGFLNEVGPLLIVSVYHLTGCPRNKLRSLKWIFSSSMNFQRINSFGLERGRINLNFEGSFIKFGWLDQKLCLNE